MHLSDPGSDAQPATDAEPYPNLQSVADAFADCYADGYTRGYRDGQRDAKLAADREPVPDSESDSITIPVFHGESKPGTYIVSHPDSNAAGYTDTGASTKPSPNGFGV